jgi:hypothetical protein
MFCSISVWVSLVLFCLFLWEGVGALGVFFFWGGGGLGWVGFYMRLCQKGLFVTRKNILVKYLCGAGELGWEFTTVFITRV